MIIFTELDRRINNANKFIDDIISKNKLLEEQILYKRESAFDKAHTDLITYRKFALKAMGDLYKNIRINFDKDSEYGFGVIEIGKQFIRIEHNSMTYTLDCEHAQGFKNINRENIAVKWFEDLSLCWDDVLVYIEDQFIDGINCILKTRMDFAEEEYNKTKENARACGIIKTF